MEYLKDKSYKIKYTDNTGKTKEMEIIPEVNMNKPQMIMKLKMKDKNFFKLLEENKMNEEKELLLEDSTQSVTSEKGFYIGDPCYVLSDERYDQWGTKYNYENGKHEIDGFEFIVHSTAYGDGEYGDEQGYWYGVDSGTLSIIPIEMIDGKDTETISEGEFEYGRIVFGHTGSLGYQNGFFQFTVDNKSIWINTGLEDDEDENNEWYDYSEDEYSEDDWNEEE